MVNTANKTVKTNRWVSVISSIAIQLCLGTAYIWGVFQSYIIVGKTTPNALFHWPATYGTLAYSLLLGFLTVGSIIGGCILERLKPQFVIILAGIVMGAGFYLAQFTTETTPWLLWLTYGVLGGIGMGMAYTTTIACCQKWFPDKRGLITGVVVAALGFGGLVFTPVAEYFIEIFGVLHTFAILGIIFLIVTFFGSFYIKNPVENYRPAGWMPSANAGMNLKSLSPAEALKTSQFYIVTLSFMCATAAGSMMIPMAKILGLQPDSGLTKEAAVAGVMIVTGFNSFGRLFCGWLSDQLGRKKTLLILLLTAGLSIIGVSFAKAYLMLALIAVIGFSYGGFLGVFPALTADLWGDKHLASIYGMILMGFGVGAIASSFIVAYFSTTKGFSVAFTIAGIAAAIGIILISMLKPLKHKEE